MEIEADRGAEYEANEIQRFRLNALARNPPAEYVALRDTRELTIPAIEHQRQFTLGIVKPTVTQITKDGVLK
jgi:hypothetical protein